MVRHRPGVLIVEHRLGFIMANAGVDRSNVDPDLGNEPVLLLPRDPDASAARLRDRLGGALSQCSLAVIVTDSWGRPGGAARSESHSAPPACRRSWTCAGGAICSGASCASPKPDSPTRSPAAASLHHGRVGRGAARGAGARAVLDGAATTGRIAASARRTRICSGERSTTATPTKSLVVALSGGVGGAKLALGLEPRDAPGELVVVANTGDDFEHLGLAISPDLDTSCTCLPASTISNAAGDGATKPGASWPRSRRSAARPGFNSATATSRPMSNVRDGVQAAKRSPPSPPTSAAAWELSTRIVPMSDDKVRTRLRTGEGWLDFQDYFVHRRCAPAVMELRL